MPRKRQPSCRAAMPVVPLPANGSRTVPPGRQPAAIALSGRSMGKAAKWAAFSGRVEIDHTSPGFLPLGWPAACRSPVGRIAAPGLLPEKAFVSSLYLPVGGQGVLIVLGRLPPPLRAREESERSPV